MKNVFEYNKPQRKTSSEFIFRPKLNRRKSRHRLIIFSSLMLLVVMLFASCKNKTQIAADPDIYYTCSMDPQVVESKPGKCPICHMDLTPVKKSSQQADNDELALSPEQMQLGNIQVDTIGNAFVGNQVILTGTLNFDQTKINDVSARVGGRIEKLYFKKMGDYVPKGAPLYDIYSEELNNAKQEYLLALQKKETLGNSVINFDDVIDAAKNKLLLWGMSEQQIKNINKDALANPRTTFFSTASGYITQLNLQEGDYVSEGGSIVTLSGLSTLWVEAQVYATQLSQLNNAKNVMVEIPDFPGKKISGKISFQNPELNTASRINLIRISIPNEDNQLKPGMSAYITVKTGGINALFLPLDAVLRDGKMAMVWVQTSQNKFKSIMVETGNESGNMIEIKSGIQPNDVVVTSGAYLLQSEYVFRKGADPMAGMDHGGMKM
ncbi:MAG: efflux RND transporter periplasmic adaptor subunit [Bacteroidetes bacterium]|jgi:Cu(I)/Ag(I) efflux system membrane fusion protein|nr:efflux RND transporter periplasmic adaptor subunit [Bacteroidota bacterium]